MAKSFKQTKTGKSPGPDNISSRLLSSCAEQLAPIFYYIFQLSLNQQRVPRCWKQSTVIPVAKINHPKVFNDFRPVALTSLVMKSFEKLIKRDLLSKTEHLLDPLQFAYRAGRGVEDATACLLNLVFKHLEGNKNHAMLLFADFSSAFNTIQPHILIDKLINNFNLDLNIVGWILDFLTSRTQRVRVNGCMSAELTSSTGSPQGCVLSPLLYILYTNKCRSRHDNRFILKFADDSVIVSLLNDNENSHGPVVDEFVEWCDNAFLQLNVKKTKDMYIDFRHKPSNINQTTIIKGQALEVVDNYKYLGTIVDNKLNFTCHSDALCKKGQQRLSCLRKLSKFQVDKSLMILFYKSCIESVLTFSLLCWFGNLNTRSKNALSRVVKMSNKILGVNQCTLSDLFHRQILRKANVIRSDSSHPLHSEFQLLPSGSRLRFPPVKSNRYKYSLIPTAISLLNADQGRSRT